MKWRPEDNDKPLGDRWHRIDGISSLWVQLEPQDDAYKAQYDSHMLSGQYQLQGLAYKQYPIEWRPLIDIKNEQEAVAELDEGADTFARENRDLIQCSVRASRLAIRRPMTQRGFVGQSGAWLASPTR